MKLHFKALLTLALTLALNSCASLQKDQKKETEETKITGPEKRIIGRITSVSRAGEFVLIQKFGPGSLPKNTLYQSQGPEGRSASLRPSGERVRDFYAADLISGTVMKGDAVVGYPDPKKEETEPEIQQNEKEPKKTTTPTSTEQLASAP